jgi:hypothetical protein
MIAVHCAEQAGVVECSSYQELHKGQAMDIRAFKATLSNSAPPQELSLALQALWYDAKDDWDAAHRCTQDQDDAVGAWVHAYLHRKEGDLANAGYWYRRAGKPTSSLSLAEEWEEITGALLS